MSEEEDMVSLQAIEPSGALENVQTPVPLLHPIEERVGERKRVGFWELVWPLSSVLSPLLRRGERKKTRPPNLYAAGVQVRLLWCRTAQRQPNGLPLLHPIEERAGESWCVRLFLQ